ncbi:MAG TPA: ABC transporter ATP-binding protein [Acidimicrobiia bacterium]|nr:ABC transporter ATP-binding protein [Acidimicrobiia bacterium]
MILELDSVAKTYRTKGRGDVEALRPVQLPIPEGSFVSLVGPSGCGKTTLLNIVAGLLPPTAGRVLFEGQPLAGPSRDMGIMFQRAVLLPWRTVEKNVMLPAEVFGQEPSSMQERVAETLEMVGLTDFSNALPQHLSGGMQQRVALARVLAYRPKVLLMDEPFGALDEFTREAMNVELLRLTRPAGITVVFVTHNISEAVFLSHKVVVMSPRPGRVTGVIDVPFDDPREIDVMRQQTFTELVFEVRELLNKEESRSGVPAEVEGA